MNLILGAFAAAVLAGALIIVATTDIALWKYVLGVVGLVMFVLAGRTKRTR